MLQRPHCGWVAMSPPRQDASTRKWFRFETSGRPHQQQQRQQASQQQKEQWAPPSWLAGYESPAVLYDKLVPQEQLLEEEERNWDADLSPAPKTPPVGARGSSKRKMTEKAGQPVSKRPLLDGTVVVAAGPRAGNDGTAPRRRRISSKRPEAPPSEAAPAPRATAAAPAEVAAAVPAGVAGFLRAEPRHGGLDAVTFVPSSVPLRYGARPHRRAA
mmetsp:Transcript_143322/g.458047  ORF Transcript_143322/g.458047 Transcript_143322/m.458047 type:complete len:215 (+) Transcript_143322:165-809(+)